jgi:hypothetical protein
METVGLVWHHMVATEPTKYAEIIEDEDTNIRRRKVTDTNM